MNHYAIYGACLASDVPFPELRPAGGLRPKWVFETTSALEPARNAFELGAERIYDDVHARLYRHAAGHRIIVDDTGEYDLSPDGRRVRWQDRADAWPDFVRAHLMGRVLATSMFLDGLLPLHASAVAFDDRVVAFIAPKGYGKSSLALALTHGGARLVTDDTLPVELGPAMIAWPGVHAVRVPSDSLEAIGAPASSARTREGKSVVNDLARDRLASTPGPLAALYVLQPVTDDAPDGVTREPLAETVATLLVMAHVKVARMLGAAAAPVLLDRAVSVARAVPAYHLKVPRNLSSLAATAARVRAWHATP